MPTHHKMKKTTIEIARFNRMCYYLINLNRKLSCYHSWQWQYEHAIQKDLLNNLYYAIGTRRDNYSIINAQFLLLIHI